MTRSAAETSKFNRFFHGTMCPACGETHGIEWNGLRGSMCAYACIGDNGCGEQWDADDYCLYKLTDDQMSHLRLTARRAG